MSLWGLSQVKISVGRAKGTSRLRLLLSSLAVRGLQGAQRGVLWGVSQTFVTCCDVYIGKTQLKLEV